MGVSMGSYSQLRRSHQSPGIFPFLCPGSRYCIPNLKLGTRLPSCRGRLGSNNETGLENSHTRTECEGHLFSSANKIQNSSPQGEIITKQLRRTYGTLMLHPFYPRYPHHNDPAAALYPRCEGPLDQSSACPFFVGGATFKARIVDIPAVHYTRSP